MGRLRIGIVGTSGHADRVAAPVIAGCADATLVGAVGTRSENSRAFAARHGAPKHYADLAGMLGDGDVDAVWICSPKGLHADHVVRCAGAGKHVLVEKPLAIDDVAGEVAATAAERAGVVLRVGFQHRFRRSHLAIRSMLASVGQVGFIRIHRFWSWPYFEGLDPKGPPEWRRSRATSGGWVINDIGSHLIDLMLWFGNCPGAFAGGILASQKFDFETEDSTAILLRLGLSGIGVVETSNANLTAGSRVEVCGSQGWIRGEDTLTGRGLVTSHDGQRLEFEPVGPLEAYGSALADFVAAVRGQASVGADAAAGRAVSRIIDEAVRHGLRARRSDGVRPQSGAAPDD